MIERIKYNIFKVLTLLVLLLIYSSCLAQRPLLDGNNGIVRKELKVKKQSGLPVSLEESSSSFLNKFGAPTTQEDYEFELDGVTGKRYKYLQDQFYIMHNKFNAFEIVSSLFQVGFENNFIKVGDNISSVNTFYSSANSFKSAEHRHFRIQLLNSDDKAIDGNYLVIDFNSSDIITKIWIYQL